MVYKKVFEIAEGKFRVDGVVLEEFDVVFDGFFDAGLTTEQCFRRAVVHIISHI